MPTPTSLLGKKVLITGASSGLGLAMAEALARAGASVVITARDAGKLATAQAQLGAEGLAVETLVLDVRDEVSIAGAVAWVHTQWGASLDLLVNNAGIGMRTVNPDFLTRPQPFYEVSAAGFRDVIDTNLTGYFLVAKAFVPLFLAQGRGKIVNISMNHETMRRAGFVPYGPSRAGAESLSLIMAEDLRAAHIDVNLLLPGGATDTGESRQSSACRQISTAEPRYNGRADCVFGFRRQPWHHGPAPGGHGVCQLAGSAA
jgi:NAD(P)-dependent dehydrogenase (short-subunit alcohol dehydrogenase family)